jgi:hypothetical protein
METTQQQNRKNANDNYQQFTGSEHWYKHFLGFTYTDGVKQVAEDCGAYWFIDLIASYFTNPKVRAEGFQVWKLTRVKDDQFRAICEDGNNNKVVSQNIDFSDFKDDELTFWCVGKVIMLPSEY